MIHLPRRHSLILETAKALRSGIHNGVWREQLPGERVLCQQLHISRPTLRSAFLLLTREGIVATSKGRSRRILSLPINGSRTHKKVLGLIASEPMNRLAQMPYRMIMETRYHLSQAGFDSELFVCPEGDPRLGKLETFIRKHSIFCCILMFSSQEQQLWFYQRGIPAFVLGSPHPAIALPSLDIDFHAVCHHAAGILLGRGHRHLALVRTHCDLAGDQASERGFVDGINSSGQEGARCSLVLHNGEGADLCRKLDRVFSRPDAPTALLACKPLEALISLTHLLQQGIAVPGDVSVMARDQDFSLERFRPSVPHYALPDESFTRRLTRLMLQLVESGALPPKRHLLIPSFVDGETLGSRHAPS